MAATQLTREEINANRSKRRNANIEECRAKELAWRKANPEKVAANNKRSREAHLEKRRANSREWSKKHVEERRAYNARYRAENEAQIRNQRTSRAEEVKATKAKWYQKNLEERREYSRQYAASHPEQHAATYRAFAAKPQNRMRMLVSDAKTRAMKAGLPFDGLHLLAKTMPSLCACCLLALDYVRLDRHRSPSLDRFDNAKGYTSDNVRVICWRCNSLKSDATVEELEAIVSYMRS